MVGAGVLSNHKQDIRLLKVFEGHGPFADPNRFFERHAACLVAHVGAVGQVVGAIGPHHKLVKKGGLVARAARGIEGSLVGRGQGLKVIGNHTEGAVPVNGLVVVGDAVVAHGSGKTPLCLEPVV
jgi:hypothetical protein